MAYDPYDNDCYDSLREYKYFRDRGYTTNPLEGSVIIDNIPPDPPAETLKKAQEDAQEDAAAQPTDNHATPQKNCPQTKPGHPSN